MPEIKIATERQMKKKYIKEQTEEEKKISFTCRRLFHS